MDFQSPEPRDRALRERVEHGVYGYIAFEQPEFHQLFADRLLKRYGWRVSPGRRWCHPGVIPGFNVAAARARRRATALVLMTPVYPPILRAAANMDLTREEAPLARRADGRYEVDVDALHRGDPRPHARSSCSATRTTRWAASSGATSSQRLAEVCLRRGLSIVADEIHCELTYSEAPSHADRVVSIRRSRERTITLMAPSKTFNLAGLKCSVAIVPNRRPAREVHRGAQSTSCRR